MAPKFDSIRSVLPKREAYRFRVRVVRLWLVPGFINPAQPMSMEMIFMDEYGDKIQATVRKSLLYKFTDVLKEGKVYRFAYFGVMPNTGSYKATDHEYKLLFQLRTTATEADSSNIPIFGVTPVPFGVVTQMVQESDNLMMLWEFLLEYQMIVSIQKKEKLSKWGKVECTIFGDFVEQLKVFMSVNSVSPIVVVLQYAKVKIFKGLPVLQNSMYASRMLLNPDIPEAAELRSKMTLGGVQLSPCNSVVLGPPKMSIEDEYLKHYPKKTIEDVNNNPEDAVVIVLGTINEIVDDGQWWYPACKCHKAVIADNGVYYCHTCLRHVFNVTPRYKLQIEVSDLTGCAILMLFDYDVYSLIGKSCADLLASMPRGSKSVEYPVEFKTLVGRKLLFKITNTSVSSRHDSGVYRVRGFCDDANIIAMYELPGVDISPTKAGSITPSNLVGSGEELVFTPVSLADDCTPCVDSAVFKKARFF